MTNQTTPTIEWPFNSPAYQDWCAEHGRQPNDPDEAALFMDCWFPGVGNDGICSKCLREAAMVWEKAEPNPVQYGERTVNEAEGKYEPIGSNCCGYPLLWPNGTRIDPRDLKVRV